MTTTLNPSWRVRLIVQTALHIGDGTRLRQGADFVLEPSGNPTRARVIDTDRALELMTEREIAAARDGMIARALGENRRAQATRAVLELHRLGRATQPGEVLALIRDADGNPYIPGSSLKGAIRTALLRQLVGRERAREFARSAGPGARGGDLEKEVLRGTAPADREATGANLDLLRALRVSDLHPPSRRPANVGFVETQVQRVDRRGETVLSVWVEAILRGSGFQGRIWLDLDVLRHLAAPERARELFQRLPEVLREDGLETLSEERAWAGGPFAATANLRPKNAIIPLGWGTGWLAHTIGPLLPPELRRQVANQLRLGRGRAAPDVPFPRSYKVAYVRIDGRTAPVPLGMVALQFGGDEAGEGE